MHDSSSHQISQEIESSLSASRNLEDPLTMLVHSNHHGCFDLFSWLHHDEEKVAVFFFTCLKAEETKSLSTCSVSQGDAFTKVDTL